MPELSLQELSQQLREAENPSPAHIELIQAIEALHQATLPFRQFRGRKKLPTVSARNKTQLMELHQQIGAKAEALLVGEDSPELKELVKKIAALSSQNYNALLQYNPAVPRTLDSLEEESRTLVLHVGRNEFGQAQNLGAPSPSGCLWPCTTTRGRKSTAYSPRRKSSRFRSPSGRRWTTLWPPTSCKTTKLPRSLFSISGKTSASP